MLLIHARAEGLITRRSAPKVSWSKKILLLQSKRGVWLFVLVLRVGGNIDAQIADHSLGHRTIRSRALDRIRASEAQHEILVYLELIALRVPTEVVVVFKDEHARRLAGSLMEEARGREAADAAAHHDQVIAFACAFGLACSGPEGTVAQPVRDLKRAHMAAAQSMRRWRVIAGTVLRLRCSLSETSAG